MKPLTNLDKDIGNTVCSARPPALEWKSMVAATFCISPWLFALIAVGLLTGCSTRIGADRTSTRDAYAQLSANALDSNRASDATRQVLHRFDLEKKFEKDPAGALLVLHEKACAEDSRDLLYALAELHYLHAERLRKSVKPAERRQSPDAFLASAVYSWFYLLGENQQPPPGPFDRRFRSACDFYNRAVARAFAEGAQTNPACRPSSGTRHAGPGQVEITFSQPAFEWRLENVETFLPADEFVVHGLSVRNRDSGLGAPLIVVGKKIGGLARQIPATLLLRVPGNVRTWSSKGLKASLELYSAYKADHVQIGGQTVPLECDTTAPLANRLNDPAVWKVGKAEFFSGKDIVKSGIYPMQPYAPGRVPVVFVHGTFSSPARWAEMWNTLRADPVLRERCQFWWFIYNSGNPVLYSAAKLRAAIEEQIKTFDPEGRDPALQQMVLIGHSQGGLLVKLTAVDTGDKLWRTISDRDFDELNIPTTEREQLRQCFFVKPLPSVKRLVFIATPHRGSFKSSQFAKQLVRRFIRLPFNVVRGTGTLLRALNPLDIPKELRHATPNSLWGMSVSNKTFVALADIPPALGVKSHSIIAVRGNGPPKQGNDGVVKYSSAHVAYADSELIVNSVHSCQDKAPTIEEVRRILHEHLSSIQRSEPWSKDVVKHTIPAQKQDENVVKE